MALDERKAMQKNSLLLKTRELIIQRLGKRLDDICIERAVFGLFYSGVKLSSGHGGLCFTPVKEIPEAVCCPSSAKAMPLSGKLARRSARDYLDDVSSDNVLKRTLGIATMNALSAFLWEEDGTQLSNDTQYSIKTNVDAFDVFPIKVQSPTLVVGALVPMLRRLKEMNAPYFIAELDKHTLKDEEIEHFIPANKSAEVIPDAGQLVITGTTVINGTLDELVAAAQPNTEILVTGPTVSMLPDVYFGAGITMIGGTIVTDADGTLDLLAEGGSGYHLFGKTAQRFVISRPKN